MLKKATNRIDDVILSILNFNIFTNYLGLARSILALGTLLTLLFNKTAVLFAPAGQLKQSLDFIIVRRFSFFNLLPLAHVNLLTWLAILTLILVISGWRPQITCFLHAYISLSFINSAVTIEGGDQITSNLALLLIPICICDPRKNHWSVIEKEERLQRYFNERVLISNFFYFLIRLQVALIYFHSAVGKFPIAEWQNGTAIYYWFNHPIFGMPGYLKPFFDPLLANRYTIVLITWGVLVFEITLFMGLILQRRYRKYLLITGIIFHFLIVLVHGLFSFFIAMTGSLILYLGDINNDIFKKAQSK